MKKLHWVLLLFVISACNNSNTSEDQASVPNRQPEPPSLQYSVLNIYPHDTSSFTEGLLFHDGKMYESTGSGDDNRYVSWMGPVDLKTGKLLESTVTKHVKINPTLPLTLFDKF